MEQRALTHATTSPIKNANNPHAINDSINNSINGHHAAAAGNHSMMATLVANMLISPRLNREHAAGIHAMPSRAGSHSSTNAAHGNVDDIAVSIAAICRHHGVIDTLGLTDINGVSDASGKHADSIVSASSLPPIVMRPVAIIMLIGSIAACAIASRSIDYDSSVLTTRALTVSRPASYSSSPSRSDDRVSIDAGDDADTASDDDTIGEDDSSRLSYDYVGNGMDKMLTLSDGRVIAEQTFVDSGEWDLSDDDVSIPHTLSLEEQAVKHAVEEMSEQRDADRDRILAIGDDDTDSDDTDFMTGYKPVLTASTVKELNKAYDHDSAHDGYEPGHWSGDSGVSYSFSQCTWWAYTRRKQLGLPIGSHMGDGHAWAGTARSLGYWVDRTPHVGDVMVFERGQLGASSTYGHVAIVEDVLTVDGRQYVVTSETGASYNGVPFSRVITDVSNFEYIHF